MYLKIGVSIYFFLKSFSSEIKLQPLFKLLWSIRYLYKINYNKNKWYENAFIGLNVLGY